MTDIAPRRDAVDEHELWERLPAASPAGDARRSADTECR
jgi:hypothetical protein